MLTTVLTVIHLVVCLVLIATVLFQSGKTAGIGGSIDGAADTFFGRNKARSLDAKLAKLTGVFAVIFIALTFALTII